MPREMVTLQVGQCGNQIGTRFWELALKEHANVKEGKERARFDDAMSSFFRNVDTRTDPPTELPVGDGRGLIKNLKARAVLIDMEEGVVSEVMRGPLRDVFDTHQLLTDTSGSGNNWAHGHDVYATQYRESLLETVRHAVEPCESLQGFFMLHSLGGGTGSGLGSALFDFLADEYPAVYRFATSIFPSEDDDVITSPYNSMLSAATLAEHADCVLPIENQALMDICDTIANQAKRSPVKASATGSQAEEVGAGGRGGRGGTPFNAMNGIAANLLLHLTSSVRFEGSLNTDLNEITMNLVPYKKQHFLLSSLSPLTGSADLARLAPNIRGIDSMMSSLFARENQLIRADPRNSTFLACGLFVRGAATISDMARNVSRLKQNLKMVHWNPEGFKVGLCSVPPAGLQVSALSLSNNCCIRHTFASMRERFQKLYKKKVYLHHYTQYMDSQKFEEADEIISDLIQEYISIDNAKPASTYRRLRPIGTRFSL